jgi:hypothetical protein
MTDRIATLNRLTGRIVKAVVSLGGQDRKARPIVKRLGENAKELGLELIRPNAKQLDGLAKFYEAWNLWTSICVDAVGEVADMIPEITKVVREARDARDYYTVQEFKEAFEEQSRSLMTPEDFGIDTEALARAIRERQERGDTEADPDEHKIH